MPTKDHARKIHLASPELKARKYPYTTDAFFFSDDIKKWITGPYKKNRSKENDFIINEVKRHSKGRASNL